MNNDLPDITDIDDRFRPPPDWQWGEFINSEGKRIRYGFVLPKGKAKAHVIGLQGLSEFAEKYFEIARDMLARDMAFYMLDWCCQGGSERLLKNPHKRHVISFAQDVKDLHQFISSQVKTDNDLIMLGHSMGAHLGLRYLSQYPNIFKSALFSAPMMGMQAVNVVPGFMRTGLISALDLVAHESYVFGGEDWREEKRSQYPDYFSHDEDRQAIHNIWCYHKPELQLGDPTFGWLKSAIHSCHFMQRQSVLSLIKTPCTIAIAGEEKIVDNAKTKIMYENLSSARLIEISGACHEIMMETDMCRNQFLQAFDDMI